MKKILVVPHFTDMSGLGHLVRCFRLSTAFAADILVEESQYEKACSMYRAVPLKSKKVNSTVVTELDALYQAVVVDTWNISQEEVLNWKQFGKTIGIDAGGEGRKHLDYLVDTVPNNLKHAPNYFQLGLSVPSDIAEARQTPRSIRKVLYYPHMEHLKHLETIRDIFAARYIKLSCIVHSKEIEKKIDELGIEKVKNSVQLYQEMHKYDLYIAHFGLGAFEALKSGIPVVLFNISRYHQQLSEIVPFPQSFTGIDSLQNYITNLDVQAFSRLVRSCLEIKIQNKPSLNSFIEYLLLFDEEDQSSYHTNPWLGIKADPVVFRSREKTVYYCKKLRQCYQYSYFNEKPSYDARYFNEEYKAQYGRSYLEDMEHIEKKMKKRLRILRHILASTEKQRSVHPSSPPHTLLDLGSSYGAMINVALENNFIPVGIDISQEAVSYIREHTKGYACNFDLRVPNWEQDLSAFLAEQKLQPPVVITAWFVLEHFPNIQRILDSIYRLLPSGGVLALSVPNARGISARRNFEKFCKNSPNDHYSLFTPSGLKKYLKRGGFKVKKTRSTGFHISRFPLGYMFFLFWYIASKIWKLGDTFEIYAVKK